MGVGYSTYYYHPARGRYVHYHPPPHRVVRYYDPYPYWWGYHYIYNPIEKKNMRVNVKKIDQHHGEVYSEDGTFITKIKVQCNNPGKPKGMTYENTAKVVDSKGKYVGETFIDDKHGIEDSEDWRGYIIVSSDKKYKV